MKKPDLSAPHEKTNKMPMFSKILGCIVIVGIVLSQANLGIDFEIERFLAKKGITDPEYKECTIEELLSTYDDVADATENDYLNTNIGVYVDFEGVCAIDQKPDSDTIMLEPESGSAQIFMWANCTNDEQKEEIKNLKRGDVIAVKGLMTSISPYGYNLDMHDMEIIKGEQQ